MRTLMNLLFVLLCLPIFGFQSVAVASKWKDLGNGAGYQGTDPWQFVGPFFLLDPHYTCPQGSMGPLKPNFQEVIRADHIGPDGCSGNDCNTIFYARQNACGGAVTYFDSSFYRSEVHNAAQDSKIYDYGFYLMSFDGKIYDEQLLIPTPDETPTWKEVWCENLTEEGEIPLNSYIDIKIESGAKSNNPNGTVYYRTETTSEDFEYRLFALEDETLQREILPNSKYRYTSENIHLEVTQTSSQQPKTAGILKLEVPGRKIESKVYCTVQGPPKKKQ